ncbi:hypothetical protein ACLQ2R_17065 [Streptosporangium sp. DT93]
MTPAERLATALLALNRLDSAMTDSEPRPSQDDPARTQPPRRTK